LFDGRNTPDDEDANPSEQFKNGFNRFWQLFEFPERTLNFFVLLIVSFLWQEHQALNEKSESPMTTELTMNSHHWQQLYFRQER
jgi:hypothetical protein